MIILSPYSYPLIDAADVNVMALNDTIWRMNLQQSCIYAPIAFTLQYIRQDVRFAHFFLFF